MTDDLTRNQKFLRQAKTVPFWMYIAFGGLVTVGGALAVEVTNIDPSIAFLAGIGVSVLMEVPLDNLQDRAYERAGLTDDTENSR